ncbi:glycosyl transferase family 39 [Microcystis aeruginosa NIES-3806]|uniref:ArnT family glycosyltransferase n=1 Tax=Microcystis aeruginosa TaxID=1126 RepID=UPI001309F35F|nr:glycosyltransferase family 39 protein [Microcystis aeruginosa]GCL53624.1 glycosyl transferase family 39 [Microcystis aeruginosa NIES-3806]
MPSFLTVHKHWLIGAIITFLGAFLRIYNYDSLPPDNWTSDEYAFAWSGMSLLQTGIPTSWSWLSPTDNFPTVVWEAKNLRYRLVTPWFDHPPLFGLLVGLFALLGGAKTFFDCSLTIIRVPSLLLGIASIVLVYLLALKLSNLSIAIIASLIYATNPNTVFLSRLAISENLMIVFCLFIILLYWQYYQTHRKKYLYIAACLAGLACLVKVTAIYLVVLLIVLLIYEKQGREAIYVTAIGAFFFSLYFLYGAIYDYDFFRKIFQEQSLRFEDFNFVKYLTTPTVFFEDGWLIFSWLTLLPFLRKNPASPQVRLLALPVILYTLILVATGAQSHFFTWYMIPFYPFMFIILAIFLDDFRQETDGLTASIIFIFLGVWSIHLNLTAWILASPYGRYYFMIGTAAILGVFYLKDIFGLFKKFWIDRFTFLLFLALLAANINVVLTYKFSG